MQKLLHSKGAHQQNKKTAYGSGGKYLQKNINTHKINSSYKSKNNVLKPLGKMHKEFEQTVQKKESKSSINIERYSSLWLPRN